VDCSIGTCFRIFWQFVAVLLRFQHALPRSFAGCFAFEHIGFITSTRINSETPVLLRCSLSGIGGLKKQKQTYQDAYGRPHQNWCGKKGTYKNKKAAKSAAFPVLNVSLPHRVHTVRPGANSREIQIDEA
jgi:hypothetical protein